MSDPWFDPNMYAWIPGTVYGVSAGLLGALSGTFASQGKGRRWVLGVWWLFSGIGAVFLVAGISVFLLGQPYGIWYGLGLPGLLGLILFPSLMPVIVQRYRVAEERRIQAADLTRT